MFIQREIRSRNELRVRPSVRPHGTTVSLGTDFREIWYQYFSKICREKSSLIKSDKNNGHFNENYKENQKTHFYVQYPPPNHAVYKTMWKIIVERAGHR